MTRELLENAAINVAHCGRELDKAKAALDKAKAALETAQLTLDRAKDELVERALAFRSSVPAACRAGQSLGMPAPPPMAPAMPAPSGPWGKS